jgi:cold shock CspA family protein
MGAKSEVFRHSVAEDFALMGFGKTFRAARAPQHSQLAGRHRGRAGLVERFTTLERAGLSKLVEGQRVRMIIGPGEKGPEAMSIELLD